MWRRFGGISVSVFGYGRRYKQQVLRQARYPSGKLHDVKSGCLNPELVHLFIIGNSWVHILWSSEVHFVKFCGDTSKWAAVASFHFLSNLLLTSLKYWQCPHCFSSKCWEYPRCFTSNCWQCPHCFTFNYWECPHFLNSKCWQCPHCLNSKCWQCPHCLNSKYWQCPHCFTSNCWQCPHFFYFQLLAVSTLLKFQLLTVSTLFYFQLLTVSTLFYFQLLHNVSLWTHTHTHTHTHIRVLVISCSHFIFYKLLLIACCEIFTVFTDLCSTINRRHPILQDVLGELFTF